jgi:hypothetical protein
MIMSTKNDIFNEHKAEYFKADKKKKGSIITHVCAITGMHRKAAIRKFRAFQKKDPCAEEHRGRKTYYTPDVTAALHDIWEDGNEACGELLHPMIGEYIDILIRDDMWKHDEEATGKLLAMSEATAKISNTSCPYSLGHGKTDLRDLDRSIPFVTAIRQREMPYTPVSTRMRRLLPYFRGHSGTKAKTRLFQVLSIYATICICP